MRSLVCTCAPLGAWILLLASQQALGVSLLAPGDPIIAIAATSPSRSPVGEGPNNMLDGDSTTKYLNFGEENSGFIVTPAIGATTVQYFMITTANDHPERDPTSWELYGTNSTIISADNSTGGDEVWDYLGAGSLELPTARWTDGPLVSLTNSTAYTSYKMVFPTVRDAAAANSMQFSGISLRRSELGPSVLGTSDPVLAIDVDGNSGYNRNESAVRSIDGSVDSKYLNFGKENSGFIITPAAGPKAVQYFEITTANDHSERDPASWALYGTNDPITSIDHSWGDKESWTFVDGGELNLPEARKTAGGLVAVNNSSTPYASYKMVFPTLKNGNAANSMQYSEIGFFDSPIDPSFLSPSASILAINTTVVANSSYSEGEAPPEAIDNNVGTKYLNFAKGGSGFIVTPSIGECVVTSFQVTTANDYAERDPTSFELYGTNDPITSADNSMGDEETWTLIASGAINLPMDRFAAGDVVSFANETAYTSYKMRFPTLRDRGAANSLQFSEIQFFGTSTEPRPGDADGDGVVNAVDAAILAANWLQSVTGKATDGDFNGDGVVDDLDASILAANWHYTGTSAAVPEPASGLLLLVGVVAGALVAYRRRAR